MVVEGSESKVAFFAAGANNLAEPCLRPYEQHTSACCAAAEGPAGHRRRSLKFAFDFPFRGSRAGLFRNPVFDGAFCRNALRVHEPGVVAGPKAGSAAGRIFQDLYLVLSGHGIMAPRLGRIECFIGHLPANAEIPDIFICGRRH